MKENGLDGESIALALSVSPSGIDAAVARRLQEQVKSLAKLLVVDRSTFSFVCPVKTSLRGM